MTRTEAIEFLRSAGMTASARDWAMGKTIALTVGEQQVHAGITFYPGGVVYICPHSDGRWMLLDCYYQDGRARVPGISTGQSYPDLESAVYAAHDYVVQVETNRPQQSERPNGDAVGPQQDEKRHCALLAAAILRGDADMVGASIDLVAALRAAGLERDPDALCLQGFCSDTDRFPRGTARALWNADALADNDAERERYIESWRRDVMAACRSLITKLSGP